MKIIYILILVMKAGYSGYAANLGEYSTKAECVEASEHVNAQFDPGFLASTDVMCIQVPYSTVIR